MEKSTTKINKLNTDSVPDFSWLVSIIFKERHMDTYICLKIHWSTISGALTRETAQGFTLRRVRKQAKGRSSKFSLQGEPSRLNKNPQMHNFFPTKTEVTIFFCKHYWLWKIISHLLNLITNIANTKSKTNHMLDIVCLSLHPLRGRIETQLLLGPGYNFIQSNHKHHLDVL